MGKQFNALQPQHMDFIKQQKIFFVGTAASSGRVNISPKGGDSFRIINENQVIWQNLTGSGNETAAHIYHLSRMTLMFCAFEGNPLILRLYGEATAIHKADKQWQEYIDLFPLSVGTRQFYHLTIDMVQTSCGMSVPFFDYLDDRDQLTNWAEARGPEGIHDYWKNRNQHSIDNMETHIVKLAGIADESID
ncbi:pyridoxamine 5'-phosphate oxidase family protein [Shewanella surugensis]|uniref:Pyridoxamine 5'-phosphate oxidase family protein n=1 Tax=Shewanella surugensis TaxID=212020 RepID=A0ABT0LL72_9GAMM|nr:pyridoxamine 5'-phosphate oxidase family protein [Shewanella surugensis]MCL1127911.1 pyridoxamine 5'-phosphate oxidase family protein [Shewanella surugensis]